MPSFFERIFGRKVLPGGWVARWHQGEVVEFVRDDYRIYFNIPPVEGGFLKRTFYLKLSEIEFRWAPPHEEETIDEKQRNFLISLLLEELGLGFVKVVVLE